MRFLLQERYRFDQWQLLIVCIMLNKTHRWQVKPVAERFFYEFKTAYDVLSCDFNELIEILHPLGMQEKRAETILRFCRDYISIDWKEPIELYGIGEYAYDSWQMFIKQDNTVLPKDRELRNYMRREKKQGIIFSILVLLLFFITLLTIAYIGYTALDLMAIQSGIEESL